MPVNSFDVARRAGVSRSTVSYVLNGQGHRFTEETRRAVEAAVQELGYRPAAAAQVLARGRSDIVVLVMPLAAYDEFWEGVDRLTADLSSAGISLLVRSATSSLESFRGVIAAVRPRAVVSWTALSAAETSMLEQAGTKIIDLARATSTMGGFNWGVGCAQAEHLSSRGFERLRYLRLTNARDDVMQQAREAGFRARALELGVTVEDSVSIDARSETAVDVVRLLEQGTGLGAYNDVAAAAALAAAQSIGILVPGALGLVGVDDSSVATHTTPRLSSVEVDVLPFVHPVVEAVVEESDVDFTVPPVAWRVVPGGTT
ncbi:LacI family DNA-binding transcriptional regulator [Microbacterium sp. NPDC079995]|uniref:LacI family DNA-binding transcriptional regulator n=1 Tax=unclassified Microbacterium TaxID=2609290 RepID=UPI00344BBBCB